MRRFTLAFAFLIILVMVVGCSGGIQLPGQTAAAAMVNGKAVTQAAYERQIVLATTYLKAQGVDDKTPEGQTMLAQMRDELLDQMIEQEIMNQAAAREGLVVTKDEVDKAFATTVADAGGQDKLDEWLKTSGFTLDEFRQTILEQLTDEKLFNKVVATVPTTAEQVHARHIMVNTEEDAKAVLARLKAGEDFVKIAQEVSLDDGSKEEGGDLGFFPKGYMIPEFEAAAFSLQPGTFSDPVKSQYGYHIIMVVERDPNHPLDEQMLHMNQQEAFAAWLDGEKAAAKIEKLVQAASK